MANRRRALLSEAGLDGAPPAAVRFFWQRRQRSTGRVDATVGELAGKVIDSIGEGLDRVSRVWRTAAPGAYADRTAPERLSRGVLTVIADSASTAYVLRRRDVPALLRSLTAALGERLVTKVVVRVGPSRPARGRSAGAVPASKE